MFVAWVYDCTNSESGYVKWLEELRSGNSKSKIVEWVSQDPEADRWDYVDPDPFPGGIMGTRRGALNVGVSESVGGLDAPPGMGFVKVARKGRDNSLVNYRSLDKSQGSGMSAEEVARRLDNSAGTNRQPRRR